MLRFVRHRRTSSGKWLRDETLVTVLKVSFDPRPVDIYMGGDAVLPKLVWDFLLGG